AYNPEVARDLLRSELQRLTPRTQVEAGSLKNDFRAIRDRGISISHEEAVMGVVGMSAPIFLEDQIVGAAHISVLQGQLDNYQLTMVSDRLMTVAKQIEGELHESLNEPRRKPSEIKTNELETQTV